MDQVPEEPISNLEGENVAYGSANYAVSKTLLKGDALTVFEAAETSYGTVTLVNFEKCLDNVAQMCFLRNQCIQRNVK